MPVLRLLLHERYGPTYVLTILLTTGIEILNNFRRKIRRFQPVTQLRERFECGLCVREKLAEEGDDAPPKVALRLPIAKTFSH